MGMSKRVPPHIFQAVFRGFPLFSLRQKTKLIDSQSHRAHHPSLRNRNIKCKEMAAVLGQTAFLGVAPRVAAKVRLCAAKEGLSPRVGKNK